MNTACAPVRDNGQHDRSRNTHQHRHNCHGIGDWRRPRIKTPRTNESSGDRRARTHHAHHGWAQPGRARRPRVCRCRRLGGSIPHHHRVPSNRQHYRVASRNRITSRTFRVFHPHQNGCEIRRKQRPRAIHPGVRRRVPHFRNRAPGNPWFV